MKDEITKASEKEYSRRFGIVILTSLAFGGICYVIAGPVGDKLGPGFRDLLQGAAILLMLIVAGIRLKRLARSKPSPNDN